MKPGSGFHIWDPKTTSIQIYVRSLIQVERVKTRGVRAIRQYNFVGDSVMSLRNSTYRFEMVIQSARVIVVNSKGDPNTSVTR